MRLIDADTLLDEYDKIHIGEPGRARKLITEQPTIDAVEVVRCKDCKWRHDDSSPQYLPCMNWYPQNDFFCAYGERRDDG